MKGTRWVSTLFRADSVCLRKARMIPTMTVRAIRSSESGAGTVCVLVDCYCRMCGVVSTTCTCTCMFTIYMYTCTKLCMLAYER